MQPRFIIFVSFMTAMISLATRWIGKRLVTDSHFPPAVKTALWTLLICMVSSIVLAQWLHRATEQKNPNILFTALYWFAFISMGTIPTLIILTLVREAALFPFENDKRAVLKNFLNIGALGLSGIAVSVGLFQARQLPKIKRVIIPIDGLDPKLAGMTIAQLTDVHIGPTIRGDHLSQIVDLTNSLKPDLIALTGDLVDGTVNELEEQMVSLGRLTAPHGKYYITGNHEYYWGARSWTDHLEQKLGFKALKNEHVNLKVNGSTVTVAGVHDLQAESFFPEEKCDPMRAIASAPHDSAFRLLLAHQPKVCELTDGKSFHLQLSGHTHAGQFWPISMFIGFFHKFVKGLYRYESMWVYVSPATCYWGPPNRLFNPTEITLIELKRA